MISFSLIFDFFFAVFFSKEAFIAKTFFGLFLLSNFFFKILNDQLAIYQVFVDSSKRNQLIVLASFLNLTFLHHDDLIRVLNRTKSMSDHNDAEKSVFNKVVEGLLHLMLAFRV